MQTNVNTIELGLFVAGLWCIWRFCVRPMQVDELRYNLFTLRHKLFMLAANGEIAFTDPNYILHRRRINFFIRNAHKITPCRILAIEYFSRNWEEDEKSLENGTPPVESFTAINQEMARHVARFLVHYSPVTASLLLVSSMFSRIKSRERSGEGKDPKSIQKPIEYSIMHIRYGELEFWDSKPPETSRLPAMI